MVNLFIFVIVNVFILMLSAITLTEDDSYRILFREIVYVIPYVRTILLITKLVTIAETEVLVG